MSDQPNSTTRSAPQQEMRVQKAPEANTREEREFIETCYRHFNALAITYKRRLEKLDGRDG